MQQSSDHAQTRPEKGALGCTVGTPEKNPFSKLLAWPARKGGDSVRATSALWVLELTMPDVESPGPAHHIKVCFAHSVPKPSAWHTRVHHSTHPLSLQSLGSSLTSTLEPSPRLNVKVNLSPTDLCRLKLETADRRPSTPTHPCFSLR